VVSDAVGVPTWPPTGGGVLEDIKRLNDIPIPSASHCPAATNRLPDGFGESVVFVLIQRRARPDAAYWPGRRALAVTDAVAWPVLLVVAVLNAPWSTGLVGPAAIALSATLMLARLHRALWRNERYDFTIWRWGRPLFILMLFGMVLKATV
jgi:hypothetical protein